MKKYWKLLWVAIRGEEKNFTSGSINRAIFLLSVPMILEMVMEALFAVVDVFFVSRVSVNAVATVGLTESVITVVYAIAIGLSMATTAMVARRIGEGKKDAAAVAAVQAMVITFSFSLIISVAGFFYAEKILYLMGGDDDLVAEGASYTRIIFAGNFVIMFLFLLNAVFRGAGDASIAMRALWIANGLNIVLDPCLIFGWGPFPELGVAGAAVATNIGRGIGVIFQLFVLFGGNSIIQIGRKHLRIAWSVVKRLFEVSLGGMGQYVIASSSWIFLMRIMSEFGEQAVAGYTISIRMLIFTILPAWGMANAAATLVGQNLGASEPDRAELSVWRSAFYTMLFLLFVSIIYIVWAPDLVRIFHEGPLVVKYGTASLRIICLGYIFFAYGMVISQAFNGAGDTRTPTVMNFICFWAIQIPLAYWIGITQGLGPNGVFWAVAISETILAGLCIYLFRKGRWKKIAI
ncbi:MAG: MATE family efflux transporter [Saprospiraceae bacterium]|nr:MATE family efflux transporter [Saprospiraceae bacterium]